MVEGVDTEEGMVEAVAGMAVDMGDEETAAMPKGVGEGMVATGLQLVMGAMVVDMGQA